MKPQVEKPMDMQSPVFGRRSGEDAHETNEHFDVEGFTDPQVDSRLEAMIAEPDEHVVPQDDPRVEAVMAFDPEPQRPLEPPPPIVELAEAAEAPIAHKPAAQVEAPRYTSLPPEPRIGTPTRLYVAATLASILIPLAAGLVFFGFTQALGPLGAQPFAVAMLILLSLMPVPFIWLWVFGIRQNARIAAEARYARAIAAEMLQPAAMASAQAGSAVEAVRLEIEHAAAAAAQARHELKTLSEVLAMETARLVESAASSARTATAITDSFAHERKELVNLTGLLDAQATSVGQAIDRQAMMVKQAADLAETQIREAETVLSARAGDLAAAAGETTEAARLAAEDLTRQAARLEAAGVSVSDQVRIVEESLTEQRAALASVSHTLRAEQEDFAAQIESQQAQLSDLLAQARVGAADIEQTARESSATLSHALVQISEQYREIGDTAAQERDAFGAAALQSVGAFSEAVRHERTILQEETREAIEALANAADQARATAASQAEIARRKIDELGEAAFAAGQKADTVFEARLSEARALIEQSAELVTEAGVKAADRMNNSLDAAKGAIGQLEELLREIDERTRRMPADAAERSAEVRTVVEQGVGELMTAARKAAEETQAIDQAIQERVRYNYEMLSEAVRLMGVVGGAVAPARPLRTQTRLAGAHAFDAAPAAAPQQPAPAAGPAAAVQTAPAPAETPVPEEAPAESLLASDPQAAAPDTAPHPEPAAPIQTERPRLKLTTPAEDGDWSWKELLSSIDEQPAGEERLAEAMIGEIASLGIDPTALLPKARLDEIAAVLQTGDRAGAREVVRSLAPAAVRRLSRCILTDLNLRSQASRFLSRNDAQLQEAAAGDHTGFAVAEHLAGPAGRAFLLIDAALGEFQ